MKVSRLCADTAEHVLIGDDITVSVLWVARGKVKLVIDAPPGVPVLRAEPMREEHPGRYAANFTEGVTRKGTTPVTER